MVVLDLVHLVELGLLGHVVVVVLVPLGIVGLTASRDSPPVDQIVVLLVDVEVVLPVDLVVGCCPVPPLSLNQTGKMVFCNVWFAPLLLRIFSLLDDIQDTPRAREYFLADLVLGKHLLDGEDTAFFEGLQV